VTRPAVAYRVVVPRPSGPPLVFVVLSTAGVAGARRNARRHLKRRHIDYRGFRVGRLGR